MAAEAGNRSAGHRRFSTLGAFLLGLMSGGLLTAAAPALNQQLRPLSRKGVRSGILFGQNLRGAAARFREDLEDLTAEAMSEIKEEETRLRQSGGQD